MSAKNYYRAKKRRLLKFLFSVLRGFVRKDSRVKYKEQEFNKGLRLRTNTKVFYVVGVFLELKDSTSKLERFVAKAI